MHRITGIYDARAGEWCVAAYLHADSERRSCVDGEKCDITLITAGEDVASASGVALVVPREIVTQSRGRLIAISGGECLIASADCLSVRNAGLVTVSSSVEMWNELRVGVLTISDKGSRGERVDTAGPALVSMMDALGGRTVMTEIVPDDRTTIASVLKQWADEDSLHVILTTGGTGLSKRDVTPEAISDVAEKHVPGFGEMMRGRSMMYTERGFLSRGTAAVRGSTLIIAFPGSERAVRQCFEAIAPALRHAIDILNGWDAECGHHHHHGGH